jgi:Fe2+ transport system protein B
MQCPYQLSYAHPFILYKSNGLSLILINYHMISSTLTILTILITDSINANNNVMIFLAQLPPYSTPNLTKVLPFAHKLNHFLAN